MALLADGGRGCENARYGLTRQLSPIRVVEPRRVEHRNRPLVTRSLTCMTCDKAEKFGADGYLLFGPLAVAETVPVRFRARLGSRIMTSSEPPKRRQRAIGANTPTPTASHFRDRRHHARPGERDSSSFLDQLPSVLLSGFVRVPGG